MKKNTLSKRLSWLMAILVLCFALHSNTLQAQCTGAVPIHAIDLTSFPNGSTSGDFALGAECCNMAGNNACLFFDITLGNIYGGVKVCIDPPCSTDGYYGGNPAVIGDEDFGCNGSNNFTFTQSFDVCNETICVPTGTTVARVLICKPGGTNPPLTASIQGLPKADLIVSDVTYGCSTTFTAAGATDYDCTNNAFIPPSVTWSSTTPGALAYLSCTNCPNPTFNYTGAPVVDCNGLAFNYTITPAPTSCNPNPAPITKTAYVYPAITGNVTVAQCMAGGTATMTFEPITTCSAGLTYAWYDQANPGTILGNNISFDPPSSTGQTYCVDIVRNAAANCAPITICNVASCIPPCTANVSDIPNAELCEGDVAANNALAFPPDAYSVVYGPAPTPAADYSLAYILALSDGTILDEDDMGPYANASYTPQFTYSTLADGSYRVYEIIYRTADGPLTGLNGNISNINLTIPSGCLDATFASLTIHPTPLVNVNSNSPICVGDDLIITATGGVGYNWSSNAPSNSIDIVFIQNTTVSNAGLYTVTVTDANGCTQTGNTTVTVNSATASITPQSSTTFCAGGSVTLQASGGGTYAWSTGAATQAITATTSGTYTVTVTANGCTATASQLVTVNPTPDASTIITSPVCEGSEIQLAALGGTSYSWSGPAGFNSNLQNPIRTNATEAMEGTYTVTVTNASNCTATASQFVVVNPNPIITAGNNGPVCAGNTINLTASSGGTSYAWSGPAGYNSNLQNPTRTNATEVMEGIYTVTVTNANGCTAAASQIVIVNSVVAAISPASSATICAGSSINLLASGGTNYAWNTGLNGALLTVSPANTTTYTVTVSDAYGCSDVETVTVTVNSATASITPQSSTTFCAGGSVTLQASGGGTYAWSTGAATQAITATTSGTYTVTVTANGCTATASQSVTVNSVTASIVPAGSTTFCSGGSVTLIANGGGTYLWSNGAATQSVVVTTGGTYTVTVTANGCTATASQAVTVNTATASISASGATTFCAGGSVTLQALGGGTYAWNTGATTQAITATTSGTYTVTVTANGCTATASQLVTVNNVYPGIVPFGPTTFCPGESVFLFATGGGTYSWSNGSNSAAILATSTGNYTVTVTAVNGCTATASQSVTAEDNVPPTLSACPANIQTCSSVVNYTAPSYTDNCGNVTLSVSHQPGIPFPAGTTTVTYTATDGSGNTAACSFTVTVTPMIGSLQTSSYMGYGVSCNGSNNGSATLTMTSGIAPYTFSWSNGVVQTTNGTSSISGLSAGIYYVTVSGGINGCTLVRQFAISQPTPLQCNIAGTNVTCGDNSGAASVNPYGGVAPYTYLWSNGATTQTISNLMAGNYYVTLTDANGCVCNSSVEIRDDGPVGNSGTLTGIYQGEAATLIPTYYNVDQIYISGGTQPYLYQWTTNGYVEYGTVVNADGSVTITIVYPDGATWDLTVTDSSCEEEYLYFDNQPETNSSQLLDIINYTITNDNGSANGTISLTVEGGTACAGGAYNYVWEGPTNYLGNFTNSPVQTGLVTGWYIVTVTDCSAPTPQSTVGWYWVPKVVRGRGKMAETDMLKAYPNPFAGATTIEFTVSETSNATVKVYGTDGREVAQLYNGTVQSGQMYNVQFEGAGLPSGIYIVALNTEAGEQARYRVMLTK